MKNFFTTFCVAAVGLLATIPIRATVGDTFVNGQFEFTVLTENPNTVSLTGITVESDDIVGIVIIPSSVNNEDKVYTVTATGYTDEGSENAPFRGCVNMTEVEIPETITSIGTRTFSGCKLKNVIIPNSVTYIGNSAFYNNSFTQLTIPKNVITIEYHAFYGCPIEELTISSKASITGMDFFNEETGELRDNINIPFKSLKKVVFGDEVTNIPSFRGANYLSDVILPTTLKNLPGYVFEDCKALSNITLPAELETIGWATFYGCSALTSIEIPANVNTIGSYAFSRCTALTSVLLPSALKSLPNNVFDYCTELSNITFPAGLTSIGEQCFNKCSALEQVSLSNSNSLESIGTEAFARCSLTNIDLPSSLTTIGEMAFAYNNIKTLTLPKNLKSIGSGDYDSAFWGCPIEKVFVYTNADISGVFPYDNLTEIIFGENATTIPSFKGATKLVDVILPVMETIPSNSFENCVSLQNVYFQENLKSIGSNAFAGCVALEELNISSSVTSIETSAFTNCYSLKTVNLPSGLQTIGNNAFAGCSSLAELVLPNGLTTIGTAAFSGCSSLMTLRIPQGVTSISADLFNDCISLEKIYLSENVKTFGANAFGNCSSLRSLIIPDGVETIPVGMMQNCTSLTEILIPNSVETISSNAFQGCTSLRNIDLGTGMYTIGNYAFADCPNITDIHCMAFNPPIAGSYTFPTKAYTNATVTVREQSLSIYNRENPWYRFQNYLTVSGAISLSHYNVDMAGNEVFQLGVYGSDSEIKWSSSNPLVAYANECGLIVAMGITGSTVITATVDGEEINCNVTVSSPYRDPQVYANTRASEEEDLQPVDIIMEGIGGNPPMVNVRLVPVGSRTIIDWTSSDTSLAVVENGLVTVYADGDVDFGVETENGLEEFVEVDTQKIIQSTDIESIFSDAEIMSPMSVYDINGRIIYFNATLDQIRNLDNGLYIIKGKKVLVK